MKKKISFLMFVWLMVSSFAFALTGDSLKAVSMVGYEQNWDDFQGTISLKNNTNSDIKNLSFRITYFNMKGEQLDYKDYSKTLSIAPGLTKAVSVAAFEDQRYYSYYKSAAYPMVARRFKVKFELTGYNKAKKAVVKKLTDDGPSYNMDDRPRCLSPFVILIPIVIAWFAFGIYVGMFALVAIMAQKRNRSVEGWLLLSFIGTPLFVALVLLIIGNAKKSEGYFVD